MFCYGRRYCLCAEVFGLSGVSIRKSGVLRSGRLLQVELCETSFPGTRPPQLIQPFPFSKDEILERTASNSRREHISIPTKMVTIKTGTERVPFRGFS